MKQNSQGRGHEAGACWKHSRINKEARGWLGGREGESKRMRSKRQWGVRSHGALWIWNFIRGEGGSHQWVLRRGAMSSDFRTESSSLLCTEQPEGRPPSSAPPSSCFHFTFRLLSSRSQDGCHGSKCDTYTSLTSRLLRSADKTRSHHRFMLL